MLEPVVPSVQPQRPLHPPSRHEALRLLAIVGAFLAAAIAVLVLATPAQAKPLSLEDQEFVDATVEAAMEEEYQRGVSISISGPKGDYTKAYGVGDVETPLTLNDHFRVGSITKSFTATAILEQIEEGNLSFSDTLGEFVEGIPYGNEITVRDLLSMRSGVYEYESDFWFQVRFALNPEMTFGPWDAVEIIREHKPAFAPGEKTQYTNSNYVLLGLILEAVTGETAAAAITKDVIEPLGLEHTSFPTTSAMPTPYSQGYNFIVPPAVRLSTGFNPNIIFTAGAVVSTIGDLAEYGQALGTGALLSSEMEEERLQFCPLPYSYEGPSEFGYGLGVVSFGNWLGHDGSVPGYNSETFYEPETGAVIAGMENVQTSNLAVFSRIYERIANHLYPGSMETPEYPEC